VGIKGFLIYNDYKGFKGTYTIMEQQVLKLKNNHVENVYESQIFSDPCRKSKSTLAVKKEVQKDAH